jgi:hypothetical protein
VIVRILGEGQYEVSSETASRLEELDTDLEAAIAANDDEAFKAALGASVDVVRAGGTPVPADNLHTAEIILPSSDADVAEVLKLLSDGHLDG